MEQLDEAKRLLIESYYSDDQSLRELAKQQGRSYDAVGEGCLLRSSPWRIASSRSCTGRRRTNESPRSCVTFE